MMTAGVNNNRFGWYFAEDLQVQRRIKWWLILSYDDDINSITKYETLYTICDRCEWNSVPNQRIIVVYFRITPASSPALSTGCLNLIIQEEGRNYINTSRKRR